MFGRIWYKIHHVAKMIVALSCPRDGDQITNKLRLWISNQKLYNENLQQQIDRYFISVELSSVYDAMPCHAIPT